MHSKTIQVDTSPPRDLVDCSAALSVFALLRALCRISAVDSARVPQRLARGGENAELIEFTHLLRLVDFIMRLCGVNRNGRAEATATPRVQSALARRAADLANRPRRRAGRVRVRLLGAQIFFDPADRATLEVPPSDAKLRLNCRLLDGFVGTPPILMGVNLSASFCGICRIGASRFPDWANAALILLLQK